LCAVAALRAGMTSIRRGLVSYSSPSHSMKMRGCFKANESVRYRSARFVSGAPERRSSAIGAPLLPIHGFAAIG
jgi:hypothetical protein